MYLDDICECYFSLGIYWKGIRTLLLCPMASSMSLSYNSEWSQPLSESVHWDCLPAMLHRPLTSFHTSLQWLLTLPLPSGQSPCFYIHCRLSEGVDREHPFSTDPASLFLSEQLSFYYSMTLQGFVKSPCYAKLHTEEQGSWGERVKTYSTQNFLSDT